MRTNSPEGRLECKSIHQLSSRSLSSVATLSSSTASSRCPVASLPMFSDHATFSSVRRIECTARQQQPQSKNLTIMVQTSLTIPTLPSVPSRPVAAAAYLRQSHNDHLQLHLFVILIFIALFTTTLISFTGTPAMISLSSSNPLIFVSASSSGPPPSGPPPSGASGPPPSGASGPPPSGASGPPPSGASGPPPSGASGPPPSGASGPPPSGASGPPPSGGGSSGPPPSSGGATGPPPPSSGTPPVLNTNSTLQCWMPYGERVALRTIYRTLDGPNWSLTANISWSSFLSAPAAERWTAMDDESWLNSTDPNLDPCQSGWMGIQCWRVSKASDAMSCPGSLAVLTLGERGLTGLFPDGTVWGAFKGLRVLDLNDNQIHGSAAGLIQWFTNLQAWTGGEYTSIAPDTGVASTYIGPELMLQWNALTDFPFTEVNQVTSWYYIGLSFNRLTQDISNIFAYDSAHPQRVYPNLVEFDACCNSLVGTFPSGWSSTLPALKSFDLGNNPLDPQLLPRDLPPLIRRILLNTNNFEGPIPNEWSSLSSLSGIILHKNKKLNGTLPHWLGNLPNLKQVLVAENEFSGSPWSVLCSGPNTPTIFWTIHHNQFEGPISSCILPTLSSMLRTPFDEIQKVFSLDFSYNRFNNSLSDDSLSFLADSSIKDFLETLDLQHNQLTAWNGFAPWWSRMDAIHKLLLNDNPLNFTLSPDPYAVYPPTARSPIYPPLPPITLSTTQPVKSDIAAASAAAVANMSISELRTIGQLVALDLSSCMIRGNINNFIPDGERTGPTSTSGSPGIPATSWNRLVSLSLRNNSLVGDLSGAQFYTLNSLDVFDLSDNPLLTGNLDLLSTFTTVIATGCPLLQWSGRLPSTLEVADSTASFFKDGNRPGVICPQFKGTDTSARTFEVDSTYYNFIYCFCDSGYYPINSPALGVDFACEVIPSLTTLVALGTIDNSTGTAGTITIQSHDKESSLNDMYYSIGHGATSTTTTTTMKRRLFQMSSTAISGSGASFASSTGGDGSTNTDTVSTVGIGLPDGSFSDAHFGQSRMLVGLDSSWSIDSRNYVHGLVRMININLQFHRWNFQGAYNRLEVFMGDETLSGDRVASFTGNSVVGATQLICYQPALLTGTTYTYSDGILSDWLSDTSPFNDTDCVYVTSVLVFSNRATLNFRSRDSTAAHFVASYQVATACPDGYRSPDTLQTELDAGSVPSSPFTTNDAWCASEFKLSETLQIIVFTVCAAVLALELFLIGCVIHYRDHSVMKSATPEYLILVLVGLLCLTVGGLFFAISPSVSSSVCHSRIWLVGFGVMLSLTAFDMKTERIRQIYSTNTLKRRTLSLRTMAVLVVCIMAIEVALLIVQSTRNMYFLEVIQGSGATLGYVVPQCSSSNAFIPWLVVQIVGMLLLLYWATYNAWKIRKAAVAFNESNTAAASVVLYMFFVIALLPLQSLLADQPNAQMLIMGLGLALLSLLESAATICVKLYYIWSGARPLQALIHPIPTKLELPGENSSDGRKGRTPNGGTPKPGVTPIAGATPKNITPKNGTPVGVTPRNANATIAGGGSSRDQAHLAIPGMFKTPFSPGPYRGVGTGTDGVEMQLRVGASEQFKTPSEAGSTSTPMGPRSPMEGQPQVLINGGGGGLPAHFLPPLHPFYPEKQPTPQNHSGGAGGGPIDSRDGFAFSRGKDDTGDVPPVIGSGSDGDDDSISDGDSQERHDRVQALSAFAAAALSVGNPLSHASFFTDHGDGEAEDVEGSMARVGGVASRMTNQDTSQYYGGAATESQNPLSVFPASSMTKHRQGSMDLPGAVSRSFMHHRDDSKEEDLNMTIGSRGLPPWLNPDGTMRQLSASSSIQTSPPIPKPIPGTKSNKRSSGNATNPNELIQPTLRDPIIEVSSAASSQPISPALTPASQPGLQAHLTHRSSSGGPIPPPTVTDHHSLTAGSNTPTYAPFDYRPLPISTPMTLSLKKDSLSGAPSLMGSDVRMNLIPTPHDSILPTSHNSTASGGDPNTSESTYLSSSLADQSDRQPLQSHELMQLKSMQDQRSPRY